MEPKESQSFLQDFPARKIKSLQRTLQELRIEHEHIGQNDFRYVELAAATAEVCARTIEQLENIYRGIVYYQQCDAVRQTLLDHTGGQH